MVQQFQSKNRVCSNYSCPKPQSAVTASEHRVTADVPSRFLQNASELKQTA